MSSTTPSSSSANTSSAPSSSPSISSQGTFARVQPRIRRRSFFGLEGMKLGVYIAAPIITTYIMTRPWFFEWSSKHLITYERPNTSNNQAMEEWMEKRREAAAKQQIEAREQRHHSA